MLFENNIENISALSSLENVEILDLLNNKIKDILPLKDLTKLKNLNIHNNCITDFSPIEEIEKNNPGIEIYGATEEEQDYTKCE